MKSCSLANAFFKTLSNFRETTNIADFFFFPHIVHISKLDKKNSNKTHVHSTFEISLVLTGKIRYQIGSRNFLLQSGDVVIIPPDIKHYWEVTNNDVEIFSFMVNISTHGDGARRSISLLNGSIEKYHYHLTNFIIFQQVIEQIIKEAIDGKTACKEKVLYLTRIAFVEIIRVLLPNYFSSILPRNFPPARGENRKDIIEIIDFYLQDNMDRQVSLREISNHVGLSISYLNTVFKRETGITIKQAIINKKLERACIYLKQTDRQIKDIAIMLGYKDVNYFYFQFKNKYGITPSKYRKTKD